MPSYNKLILIGNLTRDPETKTTGDGLAITRMGLAVNTKRKDFDEVLFIDVTTFGKLAETCGKYLTKGRPALFEGRMVREEWTDKTTGAKKHKTGMIADSMQLLGGREDRPAPARDNDAPDSEPSRPASSTGSEIATNDDVPF